MEPITQLEAATMLTQEITELGPHAHEKEIFDAVYHFLEYLHEQDHDDLEGLDEEVEYELTDAGHYLVDEAVPGEFSADMRDEFSPFSPSVGTFEGTAELADIVAPYFGGYRRAPLAERVYRTATGVSEIIGRVFDPCGAD